MTQPVCAVVTPVYNEEGILRPMAEELAGHFTELFGPDGWRFVFVENGSVDATPRILEELRDQWPRTKIVRLERPDYGLALREGLRAVDDRWAHIINIEQWDIPFLRWAWTHRERYALIMGSKRADPALYRQNRFRKLLSWGLNAALALLFEYPCADTHGPKLIDLDAMRPILEQTQLNRGQFDTEFTLRAWRKPLWIAELPVVYAERRPQRNWMIAKIARNLVDLYRLRRIIWGNVPLTGPSRIHRFAREDILRDDPVPGETMAAQRRAGSPS